MFGRKKVTTPTATSADGAPVDQPTYANQPRGTQGQGAFPNNTQTGSGPTQGELPEMPRQTLSSVAALSAGLCM